MVCRRDWTDAADAEEGRRGEVVVGNTAWVAVDVLLGSWRRVDPAHVTTTDYGRNYDADR